MSWTLKTAAIKGRKDDINRILNENSCVSVQEIEDLKNGLVIYRVNLGDMYAKDGLSDFFLTKHKEIKFLVLANDEDECGDRVLFKQFGTTNIFKRDAFDYRCVSTFMEELKMNETPFMDRPFEFKLESYFDGDWYPVRNAMSFAEEWKDDSAYEF